MPDMPDRQAPATNTLSPHLPGEQFTVFSGPHTQGNPALVFMVDQLPELKSHLQQMAVQQNHQSTYVYIAPRDKSTFSICWFTGHTPIQRCGHGTIAAAAFIARREKKDKQQYQFISAKEALTVHFESPNYSIEFPITALHTIDKKSPISQRFKTMQRVAQTEAKDGYIIIELADKKAIEEVALTESQISSLGKRALIITAESGLPDYDIVFRYFAPQYGQDEDIATGSAASILWPFWQQTNTMSPEKPLRCLQLSKQGGEMQIVQQDKHTVSVSGQVTASPDNAH